MKKVTKDNLSDIFYVIKAIAIFSVIFAHCDLHATNYITGLYKNIGSIGVGIFLFVGGYYFKCNMTIRNFGKKFKSAFVPWIVASSIIWLEVSVRSGDISVKSFIFHLIGNGSIFYFFTIYFVIYAITIVLINYLKLNCNAVFILSVVINMVANLLENNNITIFPTPLLNPFVFLAYFIAGVWFNGHNDLLIMVSNSCFSLIVGGTALLVMFIPGFSTYYWNGITEVLIEFAMIFLSLFLARPLLAKKDLIIPIGKNTLFIYIWHLIPMTVVNYVGNRFIILQHLFIIWPITVFLIMICGLTLVKRISIQPLKHVLGVK